MIHDFQPTTGDICRDAAGLPVKVEDIDIYDYVHFSVLDGSEEDAVEAGQMSHFAFVHRFIKLWSTGADRKAA